MILYQGQPGTVNSSALFTADRRITSYTILAANMAGTGATFRINHCVKGATEVTTNIVVPDLAVPAHQIIAIDLPIELRIGDVLRGLQGTVGAITITIDGTDGT